MELKRISAADALLARGVPFVFATGSDPQLIPDRYKGVTRFEKPYDPAQVARALFLAAGPNPAVGYGLDLFVTIEFVASVPKP